MSRLLTPSRRALLQGAASLMLAGCAASPSTPTSSQAARPRRRIDLATVTGADLVWLHAALQMDAAGTPRGFPLTDVKEALGRDYVPDEGQTEVLMRTGGGPPAARALYRKRFDEIVAAKAANWHDVEFTLETRLNPQGSRTLDAKVEGLWRDGVLAYTSSLPLFEAVARGGAGPQGWNARWVQWTPSMVGPRDALELGLNDGSRGRLMVKGWADLPMRVPFELDALRQLIATKVRNDPQGRDPRSRQLVVDGDVAITLRPQRVEFKPGQYGGGSLRDDAGYGRLQMVATVDRFSNVTVR